MEKTFKSPESSELYKKIYALNLSPLAREEAVGALKIAQALVGTAFWVVSKLRKLGSVAPATGATVGKLKHQ
jgi:hypothetical protein